jgi:hypothetical protein
MGLTVLALALVGAILQLHCAEAMRWSPPTTRASYLFLIMNNGSSANRVGKLRRIFVS